MCIFKRLSVSRGLGAGKQHRMWTATSGATSSLPAPACSKSLHWEGRQGLSSGGRGPAPSPGNSQGEGIPGLPEGLGCSFPQDLTHPEPLRAVSQPRLAPPVPFAFGMVPVLALGMKQHPKVKTHCPGHTCKNCPLESRVHAQLPCQGPDEGHPCQRMGRVQFSSHTALVILLLLFWDQNSLCMPGCISVLEQKSVCLYLLLQSELQDNQS